jgi:hypothetical protein
MKKALLLLILIGLLGLQKVDAVNNIIETQEYFPLNKIHRYIETDGQSEWHTEFLGLQKIKDKPYYITTTKISDKDNKERVSDKSLYTVDEAGDVYRTGNCLADWLVKWYQDPEIILKGKMELKKKYPVQNVSIDGVQTMVSLSIQRLEDLKFNNTTLSCIVIRKDIFVSSIGVALDSSTASYCEYKYFAKGIGLVRHEGSCYNCQCGNPAPSGGKISLFDVN